MKQFLGLVGYYWKFVPHFTDISRVLTHFTKRDMEFKWTPECENCFQILKKLSTGITNTQIARPSGKLHSLHRCVQVCLRRRVNTEHRWHQLPHHLHEWTLQRLTAKLGNLTMEAYAIYMSIKKLSFYIDTAKITVTSDHLPLKKFLE